MCLFANLPASSGSQNTAKKFRSFSFTCQFPSRRQFFWKSTVT